jgi:hypothetical protein
LVSTTNWKTAPKAATVSSVEAEDELPEITEEFVKTLTEEVFAPISDSCPDILNSYSNAKNMLES